MKKSISIILSILCITALVGCGNKKSDAPTSSKPDNSVEQKQDVNKSTDSNLKQENTDTNNSSTKKQENADKNNNSTKKQENINKNNNSTKTPKDTNKNKKVSQNTNSTKISNKNILTKDFSQVSSMEIIYNDTSKKYSIDKDKDFIKKVYDSILNTKTTLNKYAQESDPIFTINLVYKSGEKNIIKSTETGEFIYRVLDNKSQWSGGRNNNLFQIIKNNK
ncbi:hypothetical protein [Clostridium tetani]|nr:hypothetical protein [Clostridium tetani]KGI38515.1 hypothetical protein LA33_09685 [Clostridium tetani ATCC 9441]KGI40963.1 hypothetical protein KY52_02595 [Clostridium tetani]KGI41632.1 hypothetical protein KY55_13115 [Clostridium tetani]KGI46047.1 hypothetical protein KY54_02665 [Clostridium tetani]KHO36888.1 hypothetical protein OR63_03010 [Clostridium tetani]